MEKHLEDQVMDVVVNLPFWPMLYWEKLPTFGMRVVLFPVFFLGVLITAPITFPLFIVIMLPCAIIATARDGSQ